ncbi:MAG TPA: TonB-dependent receptor plug domain-containing protein [Steroidobacteraceae bacterium]|nr:TonB-dependent receptor plug domain-containing protein [Steroidobacteraceae bacterium]
MGKFLLEAAVAWLMVSAGIDASVAQTADSDASSLQEIIVTAQKRAENADTVPIVMTVLTNQDLIQTGVDSTQQLEWATPGLVFGNTNGFAQPYIRGVGSDLITPGQDSPVGFYLDGVYLPFTSGLLQQFGDISRIEVLKGPQGTLYGRNTTGGAINIITRDPQQAFSADASVSAGNLGYAKATTYVTGGLADGLSANFAGVYTIHNGFVDVLNDGGHLDNLDQFGVRGKIKYQINDSWDVLFGGDYVRKNDSSDAVYTGLVGSQLPLPPGVGPAFRPYDTYTDLDPPPQRTATDSGINLTVHGHMSWADFTAITGFRDDYMISSSDGDGTSLPLYAYQAYAGEQQFTQELQWASPGSSPLQWIGGLYFLKANAFDGPVNVWANVPIMEPANVAVLDGRTRISSYAAYGQAGYELPHGFKLIAGFRTSYEQRKLTGLTDYTTSLITPAVDTSKSWTTTKPKATLEWENPGQLLYASYSTAFKAGSYNLLSPNAPGPLAPENIKAYEVGGKHDLPFLNHGRLDWAVFYYNYSNMQVATEDPATGGIDTAQNAATSINKGADLDLAVPIVRNLTASIGMEYLDARYESFPNAAVDNIVNGELAYPDYTKSVNASGNREERSPLLTSTAQLKWLLPISPGNISTTATFYHNSGFFFDAGDELQQKAYNLVNLYIQYAPRGDRWSIAAWINNAFNATVLGGVAASPYIVGAFYNDPRLFGLSASVHY